jgi:hypothetical protein
MRVKRGTIIGLAVLCALGCAPAGCTPEPGIDEVTPELATVEQPVGSECDGCVRRGVLTTVSVSGAGDPALERTLRGLMMETLLSSCFHLKDEGPSEYSFDVFYEEGMEGDVKSRLSIDLYFNGDPEEHLINWTTETDRATRKFPWHKNRMFRNPSAKLRAYRPLEQTLLWGFEATPRTCQVELEKEQVNPGEEITVELTGFEDANGEPSREFNRILVSAREGEIVGGRALDVDPALKAFRVGDGAITFTYKAPDLCDVDEDTIFVYNSCDILPEDLHPLSETDLEDKIAEKPLEIVCADWTGTITADRGNTGSDSYTYASGSVQVQEDWNVSEHVTIQATLEYDRPSQSTTLPGDVFEGQSSGSYSVSYHYVQQQSSDGVTAMTLTRDVDCSGPLDTDLVETSLLVDRQGGTYDLSISLAIPTCEGTAVTTWVHGQTITQSITAGQFMVGDGGHFFFDGATDGKAISGSGEGALKYWTYSFTHSGD